MIKSQWSIWGKVILVVILLATLWGFWYFESSFALKILVLALSGAGLAVALIRKTEKAPLRSSREFIILLILYLGLLTLYNLLYGLGIPLYLVMVAILILTSGLFFGLLALDQFDKIIKPPLFWVFIVTLGLAVLEIFLSLSFWPVDPKVKSLIIAVIFYLMINLIYLYSHNVLKLKRILGVLIVAVAILAILIFNIWSSLKGHI